MDKYAAGEGATFYGAVIGIPGVGEGVAFRPDRQTPEEFAALGDTPYVCAADRVLEEHDWALHGNLQGIVAEAGGANSHGALVAREQNIPCVVNAAGVAGINPGDQVWLDSDSGEIQVNGGGAGDPQGEGDPIKTFAWFNQSFCVSDMEGQNHEEMVRYMQQFGLWGAMGTLGTLYDNGYAQVDQLPPGDEAKALGIMLSTASGSTPPELGTAPPTRGKRAPAPGAGKPQVPMAAAVDVARFIWAPDHFDARQVNPADPNDPATTHETMIKEYNEAQGNEYAWYMHAFQNMSVAGIVYDTGLAEIYTQAGPPPGQVEMEAEAKAALPLIKEFKYMSGGLPGATMAKVAEESKKATACPDCGSHTLRGEGLDTDSPKLHCLACGKVFSPPNLTAEPPSKLVSKTTATLDKGQRVEITHQALKGQRGTILEHSGKDENFDEELYNILLDNGEELEDVADSDFKKIKSASADPHFLYDEGKRPEWERAARAKPVLEDVLDGIDGGRLGGGYEGHPVMCYMCGNERTSSLGSRCGTCGYVLTIRRDGPPAKDAPAWKTSTVLLPDGTPETYAIASKVEAGVQTHHLTTAYNQETLCGEPIADMFPPIHSRSIKNKPCYACFNPRVAGIKLADDDGLDLETGRWYTMYSENYPVPDVIQIIEIAEDQTITAHIEGDDKGVFPMAITPEERARNHYRFERYEKSAAADDPQCPECGDRLEGRVGGKMECANCGWVGDTSKYAKTARRNFSVTEQNGLINENMGARARNFHKVNIDGTHYDPELLNEDSKEAYFSFGPDDPIGRHFLW